jgi:hypothetical protein
MLSNLVTGANGGPVYDSSSVSSIKALGAKGDGVTDDTAEINTALASLSDIAKAAGTVVRVTFPDGVYMMDSLHLQGNIWYDLGNAEIRRIANAGAGTSGYNDASLVRAIEFSSPGVYPGYGRYDKIRISGGFLNGNGKTFGSHLMRALFCRDMIVENLTILARGSFHAVRVRCRWPRHRHPQLPLPGRWSRRCW